MDKEELKNLHELTKIPLSNDYLINALGIKNEDIILYSALSQFDTIKDLLPNDTDFKIILLEWRRNSGHWVVLYKQNNKYFYFNSYGNKYDNDLNVLSRCMRRILGQSVNEITRLLHGNKCEYSKKKFQGNNSNTCGRWCVARISMLKMGYTQAEFLKYMEIQKLKTGLPYDLIVCQYIK